MKVVVVSGGFDPIHSGHISYFKSAKKNGDFLIVALNSDEWLIKKKGKFFMPFDERKSIIENISFVDEVLAFEDDDKGSCINALNIIRSRYPKKEIIFCNGGDRSSSNIPEMEVPDIKFLFNVGGNDKKNSSSWILKEYSYNLEDRVWGKFFNLFEDNRIKLKELIIAPGKGMSFQRHFKRNEFWFISKGRCIVNFSEENPEEFQKIELCQSDHFKVPKMAWHQIINPYDENCHIIEIQYGELRDENDIERLRFYEGNDE